MSQMVVVCGDGDRFHRSPMTGGCRGITFRLHEGEIKEMTIEKARQDGLTKCLSCW